ncbi:MULTISPECIES: ComGF family competence protein [Aneurinibacillus]|uniref:ComGF family competence protein n=1 Tax=Aneurinibacillus thermoaerophilus TaxID=143495 RepID=A0A1G7ZND2_ANETH|nr:MULTISPECIES: ComGF family competence protein [Aneurinibacillus]AMA72471.1 hypothetical protein ACH33_06135 [Aneurinibacillus sp. XH2]MED0675647.1 ComGF family competence protein [Aneurinibacillus thermoaerophilus]MED0679949.1 ComGF family competence protein [Aneurinibacillus thermoaerophilus]MED0735548.1 ComGF family competence protein [Aneurinibacillus thermoaerophilus]MED0757271.1 ComGF family competence protein [Aneurinibacillus thermoaerophilus]
METLVASVVCCLVLIAASLSFVEAQRQFAKAKAAAILEAEARGFFAYAEEEIRRCDRFHKKNNQLWFKDEKGNDIVYQQVGNKVVRKMKDGYIFLAQYVKKFDFEAEQQGCRFHLELKNGEAEWKGSIFIGKRVEFAGME